MKSQQKCQHGKKCFKGLDCQKQHSIEEQEYFQQKSLNTIMPGISRTEQTDNKRFRQNDPTNGKQFSFNRMQNLTEEKKQNNDQIKKEQKSDEQQKQSEFVYYKEGQNCQEDVPKSKKCHWFDLFGKCDLSRCKLNHQFKPLFKCVNASEGKKCDFSRPKYTLNSKYDCNEQQNIINCHRYSVEGFCNTKVCSFLHQQIQGKCVIPNCKFCKSKKEDDQIRSRAQSIESKEEEEAKQRRDFDSKESKFIQYQAEQSYQEKIPYYKICHWYDIFGRCEKRCEFEHDFKPSFQCNLVAQGKECPLNFPKHASKCKYNCNKNKNQKIANCHRYTVDGVCNKELCTFVHKKILRKCTIPNCQFCKNKNEDDYISSKAQSSESKKEDEVDKISIENKQPKFVYYQNGKNCQENIPQNEKCHWYDIFGKCDTNKCQLNHNFKPQYQCCYVSKGEKCSCRFPKYTLKRKHDCNKNEQIKNCHDYNLDGTCNQIVCPFLHKEILRKCEFNQCKFCQQKRDKITKEIDQMQESLKLKFKYNPDKIKQVCQDLKKIISQQTVLIKQKETMDLMFIVDCTSSMQPWINFVKQSIRKIIDSVKKIYPTFSFRYSFVGYRDFNDSEVENFNFNEDLDKFIEHIDGIKATGGADIPEDMASGLKEGLNQNSRSYVKAVFLIYDAPNHGLQYHDGEYEDNYKFQGANIEPLIQRYAKQDFYFTSIMLKHGTKYIAQKTLEAIQKEYSRHGKSKYFKEVKAENDPDLLIQKFIETTIVSSIQHSQLNQQSLQNNYIDNPILKKLRFDFDYQIKPINQYIRHFDFPIQWNDLFIIVEESSYEYIIQLKQKSDDGSQRRAFTGKDQTLNREIVVKFDLKINQRECLYEQMKDQQESQVVSSYIVTKFRDLVIPYVKNLKSLPYYIGTHIAKLLQLNDYCYTEVLLPDFDKFSNNADYQQVAKTENQQLLECLPHFSFQYTEGFMMITDLQGHGSILTDPCIHTIDSKKYGNTNFGQIGMAKYFAKHTCNDFCKKLKLIHPNDTKQVLSFNYDYLKQVEEESESILQTLKNIEIIKQYKDKALFCEVCEQYEIKNTEYNSEKPKNLKQFVRDSCIECTNNLKQDKEKIQCSECNTEFSVHKFWIKRRKGNMNGKCPNCNKKNYLKELCKYYLEEKPQTESSFEYNLL
ncbi:hypothetical protein ABPG72_007234 [Tetrahymena utriculariae]